MKKFVKMSLVAAVAVTGLTTTASAVALEDAVKDTTMSGYVRARLNSDHTTNGNGTQTTELKAVYNFKTKVNDAVTANVKFVGLYEDKEVGITANKGGDFNVNQANFIINTGMATVIAGLQTTQSPFAANNGDSRSNGITALIPAGPVTIAAAHYLRTLAGQNNFADTTNTPNDISAIGAIASLEGVNVELWHAVVSAVDADRTAILASTNIEGINVAAHYAEGTNGDLKVANEDIENMQIAVSGKVGAASLMAAYAATGKTSGDVTLDGDTDSKLIFALEGSATTKVADVSAFVVGASMPIGPVTAGITYMDGEGDTDSNAATANADFDETLIKVAYKMSKNFSISGWYSTGETAGADNDESRVEAKYTF
jgi:hypothetical protein